MENQFKGTPRKWQVRIEDEYSTGKKDISVFIMLGGSTLPIRVDICKLKVSTSIPEQDAIANAKLIAAAKELLERLTLLISWSERLQKQLEKYEYQHEFACSLEIQNSIMKAKEVIKKATE